MKAQQMFEELGYTLYTSEGSNKYIVYYEKGNPWKYIKFVNNVVLLPTENGWNRKTIECKLIKAINRQCEELGWI